MAGTNVLKEFLVSIGFKVDDQQFRNFNEAMRKTAQGAFELGKTTAAATAVMGTSLKTIAQQMEALYYASQRTGAGVGELKAFAFAASQIGVSAEQAQGAIEGLAAARRTQPGLNGILAGMGIDPRQTDNAKVMLELLVKLHAMPHYQGAQIAGLFGLNEQTFNQLELGLPQMQKYLAIREKMFGLAGIDPQKMAQESHQFMGDARTLEAGLENLAQIIGYRLMPAGEKVIHWLEELVEWLTKADKSTGGLSSKILGLGSALAGGVAAKSLLGGVGRLFGGAAAGEVAGGVAVEGGAAAGAFALPAIIIAAVGAALVWMTAHPDQVRKAAADSGKWLWNKGLPAFGDATAKAELSLEHGVGKVIHDAATSLKDGYKAAQSLGVVGTLSAIGGPLSGLAAMVQKSEGFAKKIYADHKGFSIGYGHLIKPGEDFSKGITQAGALALLAKDLQGAVASVASLVKVHLSKNQSDALADFVYNLGAGNLAKSTLLKKLNAGDYEGAAAQFDRWNKVLVNGHYEVNQGLSERRAADAGLFRSQDKAVTITQKTDIHVSDDGTGRNVAREQGRVNGDLVRNMVGATR